MSQIKVSSFTALIPIKDKQQLIPTYGSGKRPQAELEKLATDNELSYIRVVKPQFLQPEIEQGSSEFYRASAGHLNALIESFYLQRFVDAMFLYEQVQDGVSPMRGIVLAVDAQSCANGRIKKHDNIIQSKADRLVKHIEALGSISEPVLLTQKLPSALLTLLHSDRIDQPVITTTDVQGFTHRMWLLNKADQNLVQAAFAEMESLYIADGHHRVEAMSQYLMNSNQLQTQGLMSLIMDQDDLLIKSFHRVIQGVGNIDFLNYFESNNIDFEFITNLIDYVPKSNQSMVICPQGAIAFELGDNKLENPSAVDLLEVSRVELGVMKDLLGIENTSEDPRISFVRGDTPISEMQQNVQSGLCDCVFILPANSFAQVERVADQGLTMPPKSTWVEPKLLTGFVTQLLG